MASGGQYRRKCHGKARDEHVLHAAFVPPPGPRRDHSPPGQQPGSRAALPRPEAKLRIALLGPCYAMNGCAGEGSGWRSQHQLRRQRLTPARGHEALPRIERFPPLVQIWASLAKLRRCKKVVDVFG